MNRTALKLKAGSAALVASALLLAACGPSSDTAGAAELENVPGALDAFTSRIWGGSVNVDPDAAPESQADAQARVDREQLEREEHIAACMAELGFEYNINTQRTAWVFVNEDGTGPEWGTLSFAETYGYGIANDPWAAIHDEQINNQEFHDPNAELMESMSDAEREAWNAALWGDQSGPEDGDWDNWVWDPTQAGCSGAADLQVHGASALGVADDQFQGIQSELNNFWNTIEDDPRVQRVWADWGTCMADAGHPGLTNDNALQQELRDEWGVLQGWNSPLTEGWDWVAHPEGPEIPQPTDAEVAAFTEREINLAVASWHCQDGLDLDGVRRQVNLDLQEQFVAQHGAELEAWAQHEEANRNG